MEEIIKPNDYVRTYQGDIGKVATVTSTGIIIEHERHIHFDRVTKHSPNIIDLIEAGDYVNGYKIIIDEGMLLPDCKHAFVVFEKDGTSFMKIWGEKDIKSIVTHEQFNSIKYEVI